MSWTREQKTEYMRNYLKNPEKRKKSQESQKEWYYRNKEIVLEKQKKLYYDLKNEIIENLGGKCKCCSSVDNLEFNHIDPLIKIKEASYLHMMQKGEWEKCELLCKNCHRKYTNAENKLMRKYWLENISLEERRRMIDEFLNDDPI